MRGDELGDKFEIIFAKGKVFLLLDVGCLAFIHEFVGKSCKFGFDFIFQATRRITPSTDNLYYVRYTPDISKGLIEIFDRTDILLL